MMHRYGCETTIGFACVLVRYVGLAAVLAAGVGLGCRSNEGSSGGAGMGGERATPSGSGSGGGRGGAPEGSGGVSATGGTPGVAGVGGAADRGGGPSSGGASLGGNGGRGGSGPTVTGGNAGNTGGIGGSGGTSGGASGMVRIYWVDTEGGASTIIATPTGKVVVVDAGFSGTRDPQRVVDVVKNELGASRIDVMITTHYHVDHVGGVPTLATMIPIDAYLDHGDPIEQGQHITSYLGLFSGTGAAKRTIVKPGDKLTFGALELTFVTSAGEVIDPPPPSATPNSGCGDAISKSNLAGAENPMSVGFVARFGKFDFLDLGDLTWNAEQKLMCPTNRIGAADLYQVSHHGMDLSSSPQLVNALAPLVAVMNNGASKGGSPATFEALKALPGLQDLWSLHRVTANDAAHNASDALTANLDGTDRGYGLEAVIDASGAFTLTNARTGMSRTYQAR